jgi:DNA-binding response OmpR family regulator
MTQGKAGYILVIDDNEMNRDMLARRLGRYGYDVDVAENGEHGLEKMRDGNFDLVMLDIMMPKMNGYEFLEHVKTDERLSQIPVIMISAVDDLDSVVKCIELGAEDYLFKPFNPVLLKARISASLDRKRTTETFSAIQDHSAEMAETIMTIQHDLQILKSGKSGNLNLEQSTIVNRIDSGLRRLSLLIK